MAQPSGKKKNLIAEPQVTNHVSFWERMWECESEISRVRSRKQERYKVKSDV